MQIPLEYALRAKVWMNIETTDAVWSPKKITIMKPLVPVSALPEVGSLPDWFEEVSNFKFSGDILSLHADEDSLSALSSNYLQYLGMRETPPMFSIDSYYQSLMTNLVDENLWISVFLKNGWTPFNRSARITTAVFAMSLVSLGNMMWYKQDQDSQVFSVVPTTSNDLFS